MVETFGPEFSSVLVGGCARLSVHPEWVLTVLALESGFKTTAANPSGARGLWQKMPDLVSNTWPEGRELPPLHFRKANGTVWKYYDVGKSAARQLSDAFLFWASMCAAFKSGPPKTISAFYCLNLWPVALRGGSYTDETVLFSKGTKAYEQNAGLDWRKRGWVAIGDLEQPLARARKGNQARFDAELGAAYVANVKS